MKIFVTNGISLSNLGENHKQNKLNSPEAIMVWSRRVGKPSTYILSFNLHVPIVNTLWVIIFGETLENSDLVFSLKLEIYSIFT